MIVHSRIACPVKQSDGSWKVVVKEFDEEIPDLGRHSNMCNKCGFSAYPKCMEWCKAHIHYTMDDLRKNKTNRL